MQLRRQPRGDVLEWPVASAAKPQTAGLATERDKYMSDWRLVKRARFNAAKRCQHKQDASTTAFALAGLIGFLVPVYTMTFADAIAPFTKNVFDFTAYIIGALSLVLGLIEQSKDYPSKARRFHECGLAVNRALRRMRSDPPADHAGLMQLVEDYEQAIEACGDNHSDLDYSIAFAMENQRSPGGQNGDLFLLRLQEQFEVYGLYAVVILIPAAIGFGIWAAR